MGLRSIESTLPPGFKFYPSDEELVCHYLYKKVTHERVSEGTLVEVDLHACEPWELPELAKLTANEWYFFSFRDRKYATGLRTNRATKSGYWKSTGKDRTVHDPSTHAIVGMRKTLVFYRGRAPNGIKTSWVMHEFRLETPRFPPKEDWVLCRVFYKKKGEGMSYSMENEQDNTGYPSPNLESSTSMAGQSMQCYDQVGSTFTPTAPHNNEDHSSNSSLLNMALFQCSNFMELPQEVDSSAMMGMGSSGADDYGFLFDVGFEGHMGEGEMGNMGGMRFQGGKDKIYF